MVWKGASSMSVKKSTRRVAKTVRDLDLSIPKPIQQNDLMALFEAYGMTPAQRTQMAASLNDLINVFGTEVTKVQQRRTRADDRKNLAHAIERLSEAQWYLEACGPIGQTIVRNNISKLGEMFSAGWIRREFPEFALSKETYEAPPRSRMSRSRGEQVYVEEHSLQERCLFARLQNISLVSAALGEIHQSLEEALRSGKQRGGRNKAELRYYFIMNLAEFWKQIGRDPWATGEFQFPQFCEHVLNYSGWPTSGLRATIRKALEGLSNRRP
jgi:hypothetical protein